MRRHAIALAAAALLGAGPAHADGVGSLLKAAGTVLSFVPGFNVIGAALLVAGNVYGGVEARRKQRKAAAAAKAQRNAGLQDRTITGLRSNPPWHVAYGRCIKGGEIVDLFTSDKTYRNEVGESKTKADALRHMVILWNSRRSQAIHEIYIDGVPVGTLDGDGYATGGQFKVTRTVTRRAVFTGSITLPETPVQVLSAHRYGVGWSGLYDPETVTISGNTLIGPAGVEVLANYTTVSTVGSVRITHHLGSDTEPVDSYFATVDPTRYTSAHGLRGITASCITLDLEDPRFQGGPPNITADGSWSLMYDPRKDSTVAGGSGSHRSNDPATWEWSSNAALCAADHITAITGFNANWSEVNMPRLIAAANTCDELITLVVGATSTTNQARYTCNGAFTTEQSAERVLEDLAESMAGSVVYGADWRVNAGTWEPPVMTLTDDDLRGPIEVVQADTPVDQLFNGLRGQYMPAGGQSPADMAPPYQNATFVAADGEELWQDIDLPFTNNAARARNIARILTERNRAGQVLRYPAKLRAWPVQAGERVTLTSVEYGITALTYRVTDWQFEHGSGGGPLLTLQRDYAGIWDLADAAAAQPAPATNLPNPWGAPAISGASATSGTATLLRTRDGTIVPRVLVTWTPVQDNYVLDGGAIVVRYRGSTDAGWREVLTLTGAGSQAWLTQVVEGEPIVAEIEAVSRYRVRGATAVVGHTVEGKSVPPAAVSGLSVVAVPGGVRVQWTPNTETDYAYTEVRHGASWAAGTQIFRGVAGGFVWPWPAAGTYTVRVKHVDSSGNEGPEQSASITVGNNILVATSQLDPTAATQVPTPLTVSSLVVTGRSGTGSSYTNTARWTPVGTFTWTAEADGTAYINVRATVDYSGAPNLYTDKVAFVTTIHVDFDNDGTSSGVTDRVMYDYTVVPTPSGVSISLSKTLVDRRSFSAVGGTTYTWPVYAQSFEQPSSLTLTNVEFGVELIKR